MNGNERSVKLRFCFMSAIQHAGVAQLFERYPAQAKRKLLALRALIFEVAAATPGVGPLEETLKWGEPAYVTTQSKSGSTIRIDWKSAQPERVAIYFICHTNLVDTFRSMYRDVFTYEGDRALLFDLDGVLPTAELRDCIALTLTYHARRRASPAAA